MVSELIQREKALVSLLKRKDAEIDDMRAGGAKVSRSKLVQILPLPTRFLREILLQLEVFYHKASHEFSPIY